MAAGQLPQQVQYCSVFEMRFMTPQIDTGQVFNSLGLVVEQSEFS
jgi:hypothetical protein